MAEFKEVSVNSENLAVIKCPECGTSKTVDMSKYIAIDDVIRFTAKCKCGHSYRAVLDKRDKLRKKTNLSGTYENLTPGKEEQTGRMTVLDVSRSGLKTKISQMRLKLKDQDLSKKKIKKDTFAQKVQKSDQDLGLGDQLMVEFHLDNVKRSLVRKEVIIRWIDLPYIGVQFSHIPKYDADLGYYMMS